MIQEFNNQQVAEFVNAFEAELLKETRHRIDFNIDWYSGISTEAGVYFVFDKDVLVYIGQTAGLKARMKEMQDTNRHSFRKKLGYKLQPEAKLEKRRYIPDLETQLTNYCNENIYVACKPLAFGRLEVESYLIHKYKNILLNSVGKRNSIPIFEE